MPEENQKKQSKPDFKYLQTLMRNKHDIEDKMAKIFNERWKLNNENSKCGQQLRLVEDQVRHMIGRFRRTEMIPLLDINNSEFMCVFIKSEQKYEKFRNYCSMSSIDEYLVKGLLSHQNQKRGKTSEIDT